MSVHKENQAGETIAVKDETAAQKPEERSLDGRPIMHIKVYSPFRVYFDEDGYSISGVNGTGPFDILPRHHNFISLLSSCDLSIVGIRGEQHIRISGGLMHVKSDEVIVFLDI